MSDEEIREVGDPESGGRTRSTAAQAASRARRMGTRPTPGPNGRPRSSEGEADPERIETAKTTDTGDEAGADAVRTASRTRVAGSRRPSPGPLGRADLRAEADRETAVRRADWRRWLPAGIAAALVVALAVVDVVLLQSWRNQPDKAERREQLVASVNTAVARVLSYDYRHLAADQSAAAAQLTGTFKAQYVTSMNTTIKPGAPAAKAVVIGQVGESSITSVSGDGKQAVLLVLGQQTVANTQQKTPRYDMVNLRVTAQLVHGKWLVSDLATL
jgi:Mce-associated membrane protein